VLWRWGRKIIEWGLPLNESCQIIHVGSHLV
jgi:hypothetical protein